MENPDAQFKPEDVMNEPEMQASLTRIVESLIELHRKRDDDDTYTIADVADWDIEFRNLLRIPAVMNIFSKMFEDRNHVVGFDANDDSVVIVADKEFVEENEEHSLKLDPQEFETFINSTPPEERGPVLEQMVRNKHKPTSLN